MDSQTEIEGIDEMKKRWRLTSGAISHPTAPLWGCGVRTPWTQQPPCEAMRSGLKTEMDFWPSKKMAFPSFFHLFFGGAKRDGFLIVFPFFWGVPKRWIFHIFFIFFGSTFWDQKKMTFVSANEPPKVVKMSSFFHLFLVHFLGPKKDDIRVRKKITT